MSVVHRWRRLSTNQKSALAAAIALALTALVLQGTLSSILSTAARVAEIAATIFLILFVQALWWVALAVVAVNILLVILVGPLWLLCAPLTVWLVEDFVAYAQGRRSRGFPCGCLIAALLWLLLTVASVAAVLLILLYTPESAPRN